MTTSLPGYLALTVLIGLTLWTIVWPRPGTWWQGRTMFAVLLGLTIIAAHAPTLNFRRELTNPDESQLLAGALTLRQDFAPWRSVDLSTAGPVSVFPLLVVPASFLGARWCAALCSACMVMGAWLALTCAKDDPFARIAALPVVTFFVFMQDLDLFQFSTEHVAAVLLIGAVWIWFSTMGQDRPTPGPGPLFALGLCLGAAVLAKLQSAPCAAWLGLAIGGRLLTDVRQPWSRRFAHFTVLVAGCITVPLCFVLLSASQGVLSDLFHSYGLNNVQYVSNMDHGAPGYQPSLVWGLNYLLKPVGVVLMICLAVFPAFTTAEKRNGLLAVGLLASAITAIVMPGRGSGHYWFFVFGPVLLALGSALMSAGRWLTARGTSSPALPRWGLLALGPALLALPVAHRLTTSRDAALARSLAKIVSVQSAGEKLRALAQPGDALTVWGWRPELHVYSGLPQGTREAHTQWLIEPIPQRDYYRERFLHDLDRSRPRFIADAVGPGSFAYTDRQMAGHEIFPGLTQRIERHYTYLGETDGVRLYERHDR